MEVIESIALGENELSDSRQDGSSYSWVIQGCWPDTTPYSHSVILDMLTVRSALLHWCLIRQKTRHADRT